MASSDDESETVAQSVTNYFFVNDTDEPISFSVLPIQWRDGEKPDSTGQAVFLNGVADDGIQKIYKQVTAWKFELSEDRPEISVLSKEKNWIKLVKPRKSFEEIIRTILITVRCLHFLKQHPETSGKSLWDRMCKVFSSFEVRPSENDLLHHRPLIRAAMKQDETLSKSNFLLAFLENPVKRKVIDEDAQVGLDDRKSKFIVDDEEESDGVPGAATDDASDEEAELFDSVCAICDNGGELLICEGRCIRSFHPTVDAGEESDCKSLGFSKAQVKAIQNYMCLNCQHKRHQCFACGKLGSSDKSSGAEVFHCASATCGYFYHPQCVANLLHPLNDTEAEELQKKIAGGGTFTCPAHRCHICKQGENKDIHELQFAVCRRCPRAYHRKCLPRKIAFDDSEEEDIITRAWDGLLPYNRVLIYCLKHKIDEDLGTPIRNHIIFPRVGEKKKTHALDLLSRKKKDVVERRFGDNQDIPDKRNLSKVPKRTLPEEAKPGGSVMKRDASFLKKDLNSFKKPQLPDASKKSLRDAMKIEKPSGAEKNKESPGEGRFNSLLPVKSKGNNITSNRYGGSVPLRKKQTTILVDAETQTRIKTMLENTSASISLEEIVKKFKVPSTHAYSSKGVVDRTITQGKVEGFVEAIRTSLQKLEEGGSVEDAKAVCGPEIINQVLRWKNKLKVYLAPFLHGMRYTSFGRHFTKVDKLKQIVDKLHCYAQDGDTIVDFCCGANDFSLLMKQKLEQTGKRCSFRNFDVIQPKNDFCFEKRDWMTVRPKELPDGSNLIMGLNPPFGVKAALANKFIDKALDFRPKLIVLIVPPETERLDRKRNAYDLVWEDNEQLAGKSFYLPGSVDLNDNQMDQWNVKPPPLYLWSRRDWTEKHKTIALKQGHLSEEQKELNRGGNYNEGHFSEDMDISPIRDYHVEKLPNRNLPEQVNRAGPSEVMTADPKARKESCSPKPDSGIERNSQNRDSSKEVHKYKRKRSHENREGQNKGNESRRIAKLRVDPKDTGEDHPSESTDMDSERASTEDGVQDLQPSFRGSDIGENRNDVARRYSSDGVQVASETPQRSTGTGYAEEYGMRGVDAQFPHYSNDIVGSYGRQPPYTNELDEYRRGAGVEQIYRRYGGGTLGYLPPSNQLPGQDAAFGRFGPLSSVPYRIPGLAPESSSYANNVVPSSAMQRYAPRLDELNPSRMNGFGSSPIPRVGGGGMLNNLGASPYATPAPNPNIHPNMAGFSRGPTNFSNHPNSSSGWLND